MYNLFCPPFLFSAQSTSTECASHLCDFWWSSDHMGWASKNDPARRIEGISGGVLGCLPGWRCVCQCQVKCVIMKWLRSKSDLLSFVLSLRVGWNAKHYNHQGAGRAQGPGKVHQLQHSGAGLHPGWGRCPEQRPLHPNTWRLWVHFLVYPFIEITQILEWPLVMCHLLWSHLQGRLKAFFFLGFRQQCGRQRASGGRGGLCKAEVAD